MFRFPFFLVLIFCSLNLSSQTSNGAYINIDGIITGSIFSLSDKSPVIFAHISILSKDTSTIFTSSLEGNFRIEGLPLGHYGINISAIGYKEYHLEVNLTAQHPLYENTFLLEEMFFQTDEVVISGKRNSQAITKVPSNVSIVDIKDIQQRNIQSFEQALENINGLTLTRSSGANVQAVSIRGASEVAGGGIGNRVSLLIDGKSALSPDSGGALWNMVPLLSIEKIEIVRGASSSLFGSGAMGGVINVITKDPTKQNQSKINYNYGYYESPPASTEYKEFNDFHQLGISHNNQFQNFSYLFDISLFQNDGHREKSAFQKANIFTKLNWNLLKNGNLSLSSNLNFLENDTPASWLSARESYSVAAYRKDDFQKKKEFNSDLYYSIIPNKTLKISSRLFYYTNLSKYSFNGDPDNDTTNVNFGTSQIIDSSSIYTYRIGNLTQFDINHKNHYFIFGVEPNYEFVNAIPDTVLYGKHHVMNFGTYVQDEILLSKSTELTLGLRYDYYNIYNSFHESNWSPKLALLHKFSKQFTINTVLAQAFRNPAIAERFIKFEQGGGLRFEPNPNLEAEKLYLSIDVGLSYKLLKNLNIGLQIYKNRYKNLISFQQISQAGEILTFRVVNLKKAQMQGIELSLQYKVYNYYKLKINYNYLDAKDLSENRLNDLLAYKIKHQFFINNQFNYKSISLNINGRFRSKAEEVFIYPGSEPQANYIINSKISYTFSNNYHFYIGVNNMFNTQYEELERYRMPGRHYIIGGTINL